MGHTVMQMRYVIYEKLQELNRFAKSLREPDKTVFLELLEHIYLHISSITYTNTLDVETMMVFSALLELKKKNKSSINDLTLLLFSIITKYQARMLNKEKDWKGVGNIG